MAATFLSLACIGALNIPTKEIAPGVHLPALSIGTWVGGSKDENATAIVDNWLSLGGQGIDTAYIYFDQKQIREALRASGVNRSDVFITSKVPSCMPGLLIKQFVNDDLKQLGTDFIDLMLIHSPIGIDCDGAWEALEEMQAAGSLRSIGVSNFDAGQLAKLQKKAKVPIAVNQILYSVFSHDESTIAACRATNVTVQSYSPVKSVGSHSIFTDPTIAAIATTHNVSAPQVALRWIMQRGDVATVLSQNRDHQANDGDLWSFELSKTEMATLDALQDGIPKVERLEASVQARAQVLREQAPPSNGDGNVTFSGRPYHVQFASGVTECFQRRDVHRLTGVVTDAVGGNISVHIDNQTMPDYTLLFEAGTSQQRNMTASYTCKGTAVHAPGHAYFMQAAPHDEKVFEFAIYEPNGRSIDAIFTFGPNPPPPPPPPPACQAAFNEATCDAVPLSLGGSGKACSWCTSNDKVHALCFVASSKPDPSEWSCD
jgi:2,5-diketo-D-gluconate reductase A